MTKYMTINAARDRIDKLREMARAGDYDSACEEEHEIWKLALENIVDGHPQPKGLARVVLVTSDIEFPRGWGSSDGRDH